MNARTVRSIRAGAAGLLLLLASLLVAAGLTFVSRVGMAGPAPADAAVVIATPQPPPAPAAGTAQDAPAGGSAGSAAQSGPAPTPTVDDVGQLWRRGEYLGAGALGLFLLLAFALKVDPRRAFYYTAGLAALGAVVELIALGQTPNAGMLVGAGAVFVSILTRSPLPLAKPQPEGAAEPGAPIR